jgi:hypothetical protein
MKKFFTLIAVAVMAFAAQANELVVANGEAEGMVAPFYGFMLDTKNTVSQAIYPASMLTEMNGGKITAVKFYPTQSIGDVRTGNLQVALMEVEQDHFESTTMLTGATVVANTYPTQGATEFEVIFDQPFNYNGGNLMIETIVTQEGHFASTKFFGVSTDLVTAMAEYSYSWSTSPYYEVERVLPKALFTYEKEDTPEPEVMRGDVNGDEAVTILDVTALIDYLLTEDASGLNMQAADANLDEFVTILDVTAIIDYLLTGEWAE